MILQDDQPQQSYEPELEEQLDHLPDFPEDFYGKFKVDVQELAKDIISQFFADKELYCGGKIPDRMMHTPEYITLVLNTDITHAIQRAYCSLLEPCDFISSEQNDALVSDDILLVLAILRECSRLGIPKEMAGGLMVMHLELVEGVGA